MGYSQAPSRGCCTTNCPVPQRRRKYADKSPGRSPAVTASVRGSSLSAGSGHRSPVQRKKSGPSRRPEQTLSMPTFLSPTFSRKVQKKFHSKEIAEIKKAEKLEERLKSGWIKEKFWKKVVMMEKWVNAAGFYENWNTILARNCSCAQWGLW